MPGAPSAEGQGGRAARPRRVHANPSCPVPNPTLPPVRSDQPPRPVPIHRRTGKAYPRGRVGGGAGNGYRWRGVQRGRRIRGTGVGGRQVDSDMRHRHARRGLDIDVGCEAAAVRVCLAGDPRLGQCRSAVPGSDRGVRVPPGPGPRTRRAARVGRRGGGARGRGGRGIGREIQR